MWSTIIAAVLPIFTDAYAWIKSLFQAKKDQASAVDRAQREHVNDGAQSVIDRDSNTAQNAALDRIVADLDNPEKIPVVTLPKGKS